MLIPHAPQACSTLVCVPSSNVDVMKSGGGGDSFPPEVVALGGRCADPSSGTTGEVRLPGRQGGDAEPTTPFSGGSCSPTSYFSLPNLPSQLLH